MDIRLDGKKALVTGASAGLGESIARNLAMSGADVATVARRADRLEQTAAELSEASGQLVVPIAADVTVRDDCARLVETARAELGQIDILVNCAGGSRTMPLEATEEDWREAMEVNFWSKHRITHAVVPEMMERGFGRIINITGSLEPKNIPLYKDHSRKSHMNAASAAKAALHIWAKGLSREVGAHGVTVNSIPPGRLITEQTLYRYPTEEIRAEFCEGRIPLGRFGEPDELASLVVFLSSDQAGYITGELIHVDGGMRNYAF